MPTHSLAGRAAVAVALMIGFYLLAISIAAALLYVVYAQLRYADSIHVQVSLLCVAGAAIILWSIIPRVDRFEAPGPELTPEAEPKLFAELTDIARATGQAMPAEVYAINEVNAWVSQRGGIMAIGSRRVMGLGVPLMQTLTVSEFRGVLAHEFGHYHGGDTALGPWLYKTRASIFRTIENLAEHGSILTKPFELYAKLFLRVTEAISRQQELMADELAARVAGAGALASGLVAVNRAAVAFDSYWRSEVSPVLSAGFQPAIGAGYSFFVGVDEVSKSLDDYISEELKNATPHPFDSHPPLAVRLAALKTLPVRGESVEEEPRAFTLLARPEEIERQLLSIVTRVNQLGELRTISWSEVGETVWLPHWKKQVTEFAAELNGLTAGTLSGRMASLDSFGPDEQLGELDPSGRRSVGVATLGCGLALALARDGWRVDAMPGAAIRLTRENRAIEPFKLMGELSDGKYDATQWLSLCEAAGIDELSLAVDAAAPVVTRQ